MESEALLNKGWGSAEESTKQRAKVSIGSRGERKRRAWSAESFAEEAAREGGGDGKIRRSISGV